MLGALVVVFGGLYDVAASTQHTQWTYDFLEATFEQSVRRRARTVLARRLDSPALAMRSRTCGR